MEEEYYTVKQFAKKMGVRKQTVYKWIKMGHLKVEKRNIGDFALIVIPYNVAEEFEMPPVGRPRKTVD